MNKKEIIEKIANESGLTQKDVGKLLDSFVSVVTKTLKQGEDIVLVGFGQFMVAERAARPARDFRTGKTIDVPTSKVVKFKSGKGLKEAVKTD